MHADRATSQDGIHFKDDARNPVLSTDPPHSIGDVSSFVYDYHTSSYLATIKMFFAVNTSANYSTPRRLGFDGIDIRHVQLGRSRE